MTLRERRDFWMSAYEPVITRGEIKIAYTKSNKKRKNDFTSIKVTKKRKREKLGKVIVFAPDNEHISTAIQKNSKVG